MIKKEVDPVMKFLVTGSSGFLGMIIIAFLKKLKPNINIYEITSQRIDITKPFNLETALNTDVVLHLAGKAHSIPKTPKEKKKFYDVNFDGTRNLCNAIDNLNHKPKAFIFISTVAVYGLDSGENIRENHPLNGSTSYAKSKIQAEEYLKSWASKNSVILSILRLPLIAGPNPPGNLGTMIRGMKSGKYLSIGEASARKSVVWAEDIASIIPTLTEVGGIYNLTDGVHPTFAELEEEISKELGKSKPIKIPLSLAKIIARFGDFLGSKAPINSNKLGKITSALTFDDNLAKQNLNWKPTKVLTKIGEII